MTRETSSVGHPNGGALFGGCPAWYRAGVSDQLPPPPPPPGAGGPSFPPLPPQQPFSTQPPSFQPPPPVVPGPGAPFSGGEPPKRGVPSWVWIVGGVLLLVIVGSLVITLSGGDDEKNSSGDTEQTDETTDDTTDETTDDTTEDTTEDTTDDTTDDTEVDSTVTPLTLPSTVVPVTVVPGTEAPDDTEAPESGDEVAGAPAGSTGDRESPVPAGEIADARNGWRLQVLEVVTNATDQVMAASEFNEPPPAGSQYTLVKVAFGFFGTDDPQSLFMPTITAVGPSNAELPEECGTIPQPLDLFVDAFAGGVAVGNLCYTATPEDAAALQLFIVSDFFDETGTFLQAVPPAAPPTPMATLAGPQPGAVSSEGRANKVALGTATDVGDGWTLTVTGAARDITDAVAAENEFNDPAPEGFRFVGVDVTMAFNGDGSAAPFEVTTNVVDDGNIQRASFCGVFPNELDEFTDLFSGGSASGTLCYVVPADQIPNMVIYTSSFDADRKFLATS